MAIVPHVVSQSDSDLEETTQYASDRMTVCAARVASATTAALSAGGALRFALLLELEIQMQRVESTLVTLREFTAELKHRVAP